MRFDQKTLIEQIDRQAHELILAKSVVKEKYGSAWKAIGISKRNKKSFICTVEMKDGTTEKVKVMY